VVKVFISYRRVGNEHLAGRLRDVLSQAFGVNNVFLDVYSIGLGEDFRDVVHNAVAGVDAVVLLIGRSFDTSRLHEDDDNVRAEIREALAQGKFVLPVTTDGVELPKAASLPPDIKQLAYRNAARLRADPDFPQDAERIVETLRAHAPLVEQRPLPVPPPSPTPAPEPTRRNARSRPLNGLRSFVSTRAGKAVVGAACALVLVGGLVKLLPRGSGSGTDTSKPKTSNETTTTTTGDATTTTTTTGNVITTTPVSTSFKVEPPDGPLFFPHKGDRVRTIQGWLIAAHYLDPGDDDGLFGEVTEAAVKLFQGDIRQPVTGIFDDQTERALLERIKPAKPDAGTVPKGIVGRFESDGSNLLTSAGAKVTVQKRRVAVDDKTAGKILTVIPAEGSPVPSNGVVVIEVAYRPTIRLSIDSLIIRPFGPPKQPKCAEGLENTAAEVYFENFTINSVPVQLPVGGAMTSDTIDLKSMGSITGWRIDLEQNRDGAFPAVTVNGEIRDGDASTTAPNDFDVIARFNNVRVPAAALSKDGLVSVVPTERFTGGAKGAACTDVRFVMSVRQL
jgi:peptidoglycan hydrolase-like protein with peptidoglycan-binding domain